MNTILLVFALKLITVIDGRASGVSEPFYIRWRVTVRRENSCIQRVKYLVLVGERLPITVVLYPHRGSHDQPSSLIARAEPLAGFLGPDAVSNSWRPCSPSSLRVAASAVVRKPAFVHQSESRSYRTRSSVSARLFSPHLCGCKRLTPVVSAWGSNPLLRGHGSKIRSQERIEFCTDDECARCRECP